MTTSMRKIKILILIILFTGVSWPSMAQLRLGINGGVVLSTLVRDSNIAANDGQVGYIIGVNLKYNMGDLGWYVQSGIDYTLEGDHLQNLNFIKVPIILGLDASDDVRIYVAYNLAWQVSDQNNVQDFYEEFANILGLGFEIDVSDHFAIGTRLNYGLSNLVSDPAGAKNYKIIPFTLDIYLAYRL